MAGIIERQRAEYNHRVQLAHLTASFVRAAELPPVDKCLIDVSVDAHQRASSGTVEQTPEECDRALLEWAMVLATPEQRKELTGQ